MKILRYVASWKIVLSICYTINRFFDNKKLVLENVDNLRVNMEQYCVKLILTNITNEV